jgi:hypothetical protein
MHTFDVRDEFQGGFTTPRDHTRYLVAHHAAALYPQASGLDDVRAVARFHTQSRGWPGIGYHICLAEVSPNGPIGRYIVSDTNLQRAHVAHRNHEALGIACLTNFGDQPPPEKWLTALAEEMASQQVRYPAAQIVGHQDIAYGPRQSPDGLDWRTSCPGTAWPRWRDELHVRTRALLAPARYTTTTSIRTPTLPGLTREHLTRVLPDLSPGTYTADDIDLIAANYLSQCAAAGINTLFIWAQLCHETDYFRAFWAQRPQRNPAGIGVDGSTSPTSQPGYIYNPDRKQFEKGVRFGTWVNDSIPAHIGRWLAYLYTDKQLADDTDLPTAIRQIQHRRRALVAYALRVRSLPAAARGSVTTLQQLGSRHNPANATAIAASVPKNKWPVQGWAHTGDNYGVHLAQIANQIASGL